MTSSMSNHLGNDRNLHLNSVLYPPTGRMSNLHANSDKKNNSKKSRNKRSSVGPPPERIPDSMWTEELSIFNDCESFLLRQTNKIQVTQQNISYEVRDDLNQVLLKVVQINDTSVKEEYSNDLNDRNPIIFSIFDIKAGKEIIKVITSKENGLTLIYLKHQFGYHDDAIGIVRKDVDEMCSNSCPNITLERPDGSVILNVSLEWKNLRNFCCACRCRLPRIRSFRKDIIMSKSFSFRDEETGDRLGSVRYVQRSLGDSTTSNENTNPGAILATFPKNMTTLNKSLILGSMFLLDNDYYLQLRKPLKTPKISKTCSIIISIIIFIVIITLLALLVGGRGFSGKGSSGGFARPRPGGIG